MLVDTLSLTGAVMLIIGTATAMAWALTQSGFSQWLVAAMAAVPGGKGGFLAITAVAFVILGSVLEGIPAIVLFGPLLFPVAKAMGVHEVHYAMVIILAMGIGLFAPPFGVGFYGACAIGRVSPDDALGRMWPYLGGAGGGAGDRRGVPLAVDRVLVRGARPATPATSPRQELEALLP